MSDETIVDVVEDNEMLARYILRRNHVRRSDHTVKPDAFIPPKSSLALSVTRHKDLSEKEIWQLGQTIAQNRPNATLCGRADIMTSKVRALSLEIHPSSPPKNHADITGWPADKADQKSIALDIAAASRYIENPNKTTPSPD